MPSSSMLHVRVDDTLKAEAAETLNRMGLSVSDAVRMLLRRVVADQSLPAELTELRGVAGGVEGHRTIFAGAAPNRQTTSRPTPLPERRIEELDSVRLRADVMTEDGHLPFGSEGTVVYRHGSGEAFEVEFMVPIHALLTLRANEVQPANG